MNANDSSTRQTWRKFYRISRLGKATPRKLVTLLSDDAARVYLAALRAVADRSSYHAALMNRRITREQGHWLVDTRCSCYSSHAGRLPV